MFRKRKWIEHMTDRRKRLYLIDGANYAFRAFYAIRNLSNSKGLPTGALYGFTQMMMKLLREEKPDLVAVCFDTPEPTFRDELYEEYKANRKEPPDDLVSQFPYFRPIVEALGIPVVEKPGFEADDVIGTLARRFEARGYDVVVVSGDKDLMQLVGPHVSILDEMKGLRIGPGEVLKRFGVGPEGVTEILGLAGDSSDNIPGVPGVGPKTATELIQRYGTVENVLAHASELKGALAGKVANNAEKARLSRRLVEIDTNVEVEANEEGLKPRGVDAAKARELFSDLEFNRLLAEIAPASVVSRKGYRLVSEAKALNEVISLVRESGELSIDLETTSLDPMQAKIVGFSLCWRPGEAAYVPVGHVESSSSSGLGQTGDLFGGRLAPGQLSFETVSKVIGKLLADGSVAKVGQNLNYDLTILRRLGFEVAGVSFDTMLASYVLDPGEAHGLDAMAQKHLGHRTITYEDVAGKGKAQKNFSEVSLDAACEYSCEDADVALRLKELFAPRIESEGLSVIFRDMEMKLLPVLVDMQLAGMKVDAAKLAVLDHDFSSRLASLERAIFERAGEEFNVNSPKQLGEILFAKMGLPGAKKTKTGFSTGQEILEELASVHELPRLVLEYRSLSKLKGTYIDALPSLIDPSSGRIHTSFNQAVAATGRLSSSDPNLQNIPVRSEEGRKIRGAFIAEDGFLLVSADYSQIELRVLAHMSGEPALVEAFGRGEDVHAITASGIFGVPVSGVTDEQRAVGKTVNFATIYGQTPFGLSKQLGIDVGEAASYIENYFKKYQRVAAYRDEVIAKARREGKVTTLFGRRRFFPDIESSNAMMRQIAERTAFNTVFQGTAADIIKRAMISIHEGLPGVSPKARVILQVHDELIAEVPEADVAAVEAYLSGEMGRAAALEVPLVVDVCAAANWAEAH